MLEIGPDGFPIARTKGTVVVAWMAGIILALSFCWLCLASYIILTGGNDATCTDVKPDRHVGTVVAVSVLAYSAIVVPAILLLRKKEFEWAFGALMVASIALAEPFCGLGWILFSIGMC